MQLWPVELRVGNGQTAQGRLQTDDGLQTPGALWQWDSGSLQSRGGVWVWAQPPDLGEQPRNPFR